MEFKDTHFQIPWCLLRVRKCSAEKESRKTVSNGNSEIENCSCKIQDNGRCLLKLIRLTCEKQNKTTRNNPREDAKTDQDCPEWNPEKHRKRTDVAEKGFGDRLGECLEILRRCLWAKKEVVQNEEELFKPILEARNCRLAVFSKVQKSASYSSTGPCFQGSSQSEACTKAPVPWSGVAGDAGDALPRVIWWGWNLCDRRPRPGA